MFALAKFVQRKWPITYGEKVHVVMLGGLHTGRALWKTLGDVWEGSGWTEALAEGEVVSSGVAQSFLKAAHLTRTRHCFEPVTLLTLRNIVKGSGGAVGLTENPPAFRRWMLAGPEIARLLTQFEDENLPDDDPEIPKNFKHHEQGLSTQTAFQKQVIRRMGNPFLDDFSDLVTLNRRNFMDESVIDTVRTLEDTGKKLYQDFVSNVLEDRTRSIHEPIKRNSLALFKKPRHKTTSRQGKIKLLQTRFQEK